MWQLALWWPSSGFELNPHDFAPCPWREISLAAVNMECQWQLRFAYENQMKWLMGLSNRKGMPRRPRR